MNEIFWKGNVLILKAAYDQKMYWRSELSNFFISTSDFSCLHKSKFSRNST